MKDKVAVLMSTYNGEKYLKEQIESILNQQEVEITLLIRDDGSIDNTVSIIEEYKRSNKNIELTVGDNIGVGNSFMQLVYNAGDYYDYYAFADQDDVWKKNKIVKAIEMISDYNTPACYCSNQLLVDKSGKCMRERHSGIIDTGYMQILCDNKVTGCTMVWNLVLQQHLIDPIRRPSKEVLHKRIHDVWVSMVASTIGDIIYDENSYIFYRQHENNVVGVEKSSIINEWKKKICNPQLRAGRSSLASEIVKKYGDIIRDVTVLERLKSYAFYKHSFLIRIGLMKDIEVCQYTGESPVMLKIKILMGLF